MGEGRCKYVPGVKIYKFPCVEINPGFYDWVGKEGRGGSSKGFLHSYSYIATTCNHTALLVVNHSHCFLRLAKYNVSRSHPDPINVHHCKT